MKLEVMKRGVAAMLCCAVLTAGMPMGALAEGEAQTDAQSVVTESVVPESVVTESVVTESVVTEAQPQITYEKFTLRCDLLEGSLCVSVNGGSALDVLVRVTDEKGESAGKQTVSKANGTVFFNNLTPGVYTVSAAYADAEAAKAVSAVSKTVEIIDAEAVKKAAEEEARQKAAEEEAARLKAAAEEAEKQKEAEAQNQQNSAGTGDGTQQSADGISGGGEQLVTSVQMSTLTLTPGTLDVVEDDITDDDDTTDDTTTDPENPTKQTRDAVTGQFDISLSAGKGTVSVTITGALEQEIVVCLEDSKENSFGDKTITGNGTVTFTGLEVGTYNVLVGYLDTVSGVNDAKATIDVKESADVVTPIEGAFTLKAEKVSETSIQTTIENALEQPVDIVLRKSGVTATVKTLDKGNGTVTFDALEAGTYSVFATYQTMVEGVGNLTSPDIVLGGTPGASQFAAVASVKDDTITVTVEGASALEMTIRLSRDGTEVSSKTITGSEAAQSVEFTKLSAGAYSVSVDYTKSAEGVSAYTASLTVAQTETPGQFKLSTATGKGTIDVTVSGALSKAVGIQLKKPDGTSEMKTVDSGNGMISFTGLVKGTYHVYADYMDPVSGVKAVEAEAELAESADVIEIVAGQFAVETGIGAGAITVTVTNAKEQNVDVVLIKPDNTTDRRTLAKGNGTITFAGLEVGTYGLVVAYETEVPNVSAVKREGLQVTTSATAAGAIVATAKAGVGRVDVTVSAASKLPVDVVLMQGGTACATKRIEAGIGAVAFEGLAAGTYSVSIDYAASTSAGGVPYVIGDLAVTASIAKIAITKVTAGENRITVTGTAQPGSDITLTTEPQSSTVIVHSDDKGAFTAEITCSAGTYTAVHVQYGADTASRVSATGTFTVTTPTTAPSLTVDRIDPDTISVVAKTTPGVVVNLATGDYGQTVTADSRGILRFYLPHTYGYGAEITFTVFYGAGNSLSYKQTEKVTDARTYHLLRRGSEGREVYQLTTRLKELGYPIEVTKKYDDRVVAAVRLFQANNGLTVDGITGILTHNLVYSVAAIGYSETTYPTLVRGDRGLSLIYTLQQRLKDLGYYTLRVDGIFGSGTQRAVRDFQANNGLSVTGRADDATQKLLYSTSAKPAGSGSTGSYTTLARSSRYSSAVVTLQRRLKALGYLSGAADGYFGSQTYRAVRSFQSVNGLSVTGIADPATQALLYSAAAKAASGSTPSTDTGYRLLYWGCKGDAVKRLQQALLDAGYKQVRVADGIYGQWTYDAVCAFQKANGLAIDGIAGKNTQNKLYGTSY